MDVRVTKMYPDIFIESRNQNTRKTNTFSFISKYKIPIESSPESTLQHHLLSSHLIKSIQSPFIHYNHNATRHPHPPPHHLLGNRLPLSINQTPTQSNLSPKTFGEYWEKSKPSPPTLTLPSTSANTGLTNPNVTLNFH